MRFLAFEGLDGSGKSTLMKGLQREFEQRGQPYVLTREPGGTSLGDEIRQLLLRTDGEAPTARAEALLYQAGRAQHVERVIAPALAARRWVLSDRFAASSLAFQGGARGLQVSDIAWLNQFSTQGLEPDLYILLDLTVEESLRRLQGRGQPDRFEQEEQAFHERVRQAYLQMAKQRPERWLTLSAGEPPAQLLAQAMLELKKRRWLD